MRILLTGAQGQLGEALQPVLGAIGELTAAGRDRVNLADTATLYDAVMALQPDLIVNAAAYTAVDKAETEADLAIAVNGTAPGILAQAAQDLGGRLIHVSTDYVFNGQQGRPYRETDPTDPLGSYGRSKLAGETAILATAPSQSAIFRTAWVYGAGKTGNFVKTMIRLATDRPELRVVADQIGSPTWTRDLAGAIGQLAGRLDADTAGVYHYTNSGAVSWYDFAVAIIEEARALGLELAVERIVPIATEDYPTPAQRPSYSVLWGGKLAALLGSPAPHWRSSLRKMLPELLNR